MPERRILGGGQTCDVSFWPFLNPSSWWWLISSVFLTRTSCGKTTHANGYYGAWPGWAVSVSVLPLTNPPAMGETWVQSLGWEDTLEKRMATLSNILAWRIQRTGKSGRLQFWMSQLDTTEQLNIHTHHKLYPSYLSSVVFSFINQILYVKKHFQTLMIHSLLSFLNCLFYKLNVLSLS